MKRNVLLISIDALGADKLWELNKGYTPFMKGIGERGVIFTNVFSTTSSTTPSIASIHTGCFPKEHGIESTYGFCLKNSITTLAENFKDNGYTTFANVGGPLNSETGLNKGFDKYVYKSAHFVLRILRWGYPIQRMWLNNHLLMKETKSIVRKPGPWFYWIHLLDLHNRWRPKKHFRNRTLSAYENALVSLDKRVEGILSKIDLKKTFVILCADHGHYVAELDPKRGDFNYAEAHGFHVYDTLVHIPLIMIAEGLLPKGVVVDKLISTVDILPSIIDILGLQSDVKTSGQNFAGLIPFLNNRKTATFSERQVYMEACGSILKKAGESFLMGIRTPEWKFVVPQDKNSHRKPELFHLTDDPQELINVFEQYPEKASYLRGILEGIVARQKSL